MAKKRKIKSKKSKTKADPGKNTEFMKQIKDIKTLVCNFKEFKRLCIQKKKCIYRKSCTQTIKEEI